MPDDDRLLGLCREAAGAVAEALEHHGDWGHSGAVPGQYNHDLAADAAAVPVLTGAGLGVVSEESGVHGPGAPLVAVIDPVDGSTNASLGIPWWATSICVLDAEGPRVAVVVDQVAGTVFEAVRGQGATADGVAIRPSGRTALGESIVGFTGYPRRYLGWNQYRALGAAALDLCAVARGVLDAYADCSGGSLAPWDYLGGLLVCREAGAFVLDAYGRDLVVIDHTARRAPVAAATAELAGELVQKVSGSSPARTA